MLRSAFSPGCPVIRSLSLLVVVSFLAALSGCLSAELGNLTSPEPIAPLPLPTGFEFACPPGSHLPRGSLCVGTLETQTESLQEPYVAVDAKRPNVIAVGVNAGHTVHAIDPNRAQPGVDVILLDIYFSEDGGQTWRLSQLPYVPAPQSPTLLDIAASGDPALAFDSQGVLHVSGIVVHNVLLQGWDVFYASTADLGKTWTTPVMLTRTGETDRNWLTVGPKDEVYVSWQNYGPGSSEVAWSLDGGKTWKQKVFAQKCPTASPVVVAQGVSLVACKSTGESKGVQLYRIDPAAASVEHAADVSAMQDYFPLVKTLPNGTLVLTTAWSSKNLSLSHNGGKNWTVPVELRDVLKIEDDWDDFRVFWLEVDPWGAIHLILGDGTSHPSRVAHAVLDPTTLAPFQETLLRETDEGRPQPSLAPEYGDHFYGLAFTSDQGFLVWGFDKGLDYALLKPSFPSASSLEGSKL